MFKAILLDLDDTLYDYETSHKNALEHTFKEISKRFSSQMDFDELNTKLVDSYERSHLTNRSLLANTSSSHDKQLVFKHMVDDLRLPRYTLDFKDTTILMNEIYWVHFYQNIRLYDEVKEFLSYVHDVIKIRVCIITDFMYTNQVEKLKRLGIPEYIDHLITSEEVGADKPNPLIWYHALHKLGLSTEDVCMIGDNYEKDIIGAVNIGITSYHFVPCFKLGKDDNFLDALDLATRKQTKFNCFLNLIEHFRHMNDSIQELVALSHDYGQRFDLVQAGGGNISVKEDGIMYIKSSGISLSEVSAQKGYSMVSLLAHKQMINLSSRPSMEAPLHLGLKKYTVHLHPIQVNILATAKGGEKILRDLFPESLILSYLRPGQELADHLAKAYHQENLIFLLSHGLIVTSDTYPDIEGLVDYVIRKIEGYLGSLSEAQSIEKNLSSGRVPLVELEHYKDTTFVESLIRRAFNEKSDILIYLSYVHLGVDSCVPLITPDTVIYCGYSVLNLDRSEDKKEELIRDYLAFYGEIPRIVIYQGRTYLVGNSIKKCREIEEIILSTLLIIKHQRALGLDYVCLSKEEIDDLLGLEAEKFRRALK